MYQGDFGKVNDYRFKNNVATTLWILLKAGTLSRLQGLEEVVNHPNVVLVFQRFKEGDHVTEAMLGTERQVFARIYIAVGSKAESASVIRFIEERLSILNDAGESMILDMYQPREAI